MTGAGKCLYHSPVHFQVPKPFLPALTRPPDIDRRFRRAILTRQPTCRVSAMPQTIMEGIKKAFSRGGQGAARETDAHNFRDAALSWSELSRMVAEERKRLNEPSLDLEAGPTNPLAMKRTFGKDGPPKLKLYRDSAAWCPYCQKVWLQLEEKEIPYILEKENMRCYGSKSPEYMGKVPSGLLPAMEYKGHLIIESADIMQILEEEFPDYKPLLPPQGTSERSRADGLMVLERRLFSDWLRWLCSSWNHEEGKRNFIARMDQVDSELGKEDGPYFLGWGFSLVDCVFAPFLERIVASIPYYKGFVVRGEGRWKHLETWFDAMETRPAYLGTRSDHYTHVHDLPPQLGGCAPVAGSEALAAAIDGTDGKHWSLPLPPLHSTSIPEAYSHGEDEERDRLRAAARLVDNHEAVVKFAARGCGKAGQRPVTAPLSDPSARPGEDYLGAVDSGLRYVAEALLQGTDKVKVELAGDGQLQGAQTVESAAYLRDRVGVPRDLPLPAARQLRAHLNWFIDSLHKA